MTNDSDKAELEQLEAKKIARDIGREAAVSIVLGEIVGLLVTKGVIGQAEAVAHFRKLSQEFMTGDSGLAGREMVILCDLIATRVSGEPARKPS